MRRAAALLLLLSGCGGGVEAPAPTPTATTNALERAAIAAGMVPDPTADPTGLYAREGDRLCVAPAATGWRIGILTTLVDEPGCTASGTLDRRGDRLAVDLGNGCTFDARFEGDRIVFPADLPARCNRGCAGRATLSALDVPMLSDAPAEAAALRDGRGRALCQP